MTSQQNKKLAAKPALLSIDEKHTEMLNQFHVIENETIPALLEEKTN